VDRKCQATD